MADLSELIAVLSRDPNERGRQFEHICKWYLQNDPEYSAELQKVWLWDEWPGRWGPDCGIDLVAETNDGGLWAIQAKAYSPDYHVRKADIDSFLAESSSEAFEFRLLLATTNRIGNNARRTIDMQTKQVGLRLLADLEAAGLDWPSHPDDMEPRPLTRKTPKPYQTEAIQNVLRGFETHDRGQLLMACGTGKTLVGLWVAGQMTPQRTLILLPSLSLLANTLRTWRENSSGSFVCLPVCSDDTVRGQDLTTAKTSDLGLPVTTDSSKVAEFLRRPQRLVVFATYQSSSVIAEACGSTDTPPFDLVIADEAHRCAGKVPREFAAILEGDKIRAHHRLFMTATPKFFTGKLRCEAKENELILASMDDPIHFGPVFHKLSFSEAIDRDLLSDYRVAIVAVDNPTYRRYAQRGEFVTADGIKINDARELASHIATVKAMRQYDLCKLISFHNRVEKAKDFSARLPEVVAWMPSDDRPAGDVESAHVSGKMSSGMRDTVLKRFQHANDQQRLLVSNARCLGEGVDVPTLDGVVFVDPRQSQIDIIQALGRAIRKSPEKRYGTIVLPVFADETVSPQKAIENSPFKTIWKVLQALRAHDDVLGQELDHLRYSLGRFQKSTTDLPEKIHIDIPVSLSEDFSTAMRLMLIESTTASWDYKFGLFERFIEEHGHPYVPARYITASGIRLGTWTTAQRVNYRNGRISLEQIRRFETIENWEWIPLEKAWKESYGCLLEFVRENGNATIRQDYVSSGGFRLGAWVALQRGVYKKKRLSEQRRALLEKVPGWKWSVPRTWKTGFDKLQKYAQQNNPTLMPRSFRTADDFALGDWVTHKRQEYNTGVIDPEIQRALETVPQWEWSKEKAKWKRNIKQLEEFVRREGHSFIPSWHIEDGNRLGAWACAQRTAYKKGRLHQDKCRDLELISCWSWIWEGVKNRVAPWHEGFWHLKEFAESEGHTRVARDYKSPDGFTLGAWLTELRKLHCRGLVKPDQERELYKLPYWGWTLAEMVWHRAYERLVRHIDGRGVDCVSGKTLAVDGFRLGAWVSNQRKKFHSGALTEEQKELLEQLSGWSWDPHADAWRVAYGKLQTLIEEEGAEVVTINMKADDGFCLGAWVQSQRRALESDRLSEERKKALEALHGWPWEPKSRDRRHQSEKPRKKYDRSWERHLKEVQAYAMKHGHARVPQRHSTEEGFSLGAWTATQRRAFKKGKLPDKRRSLLERLPGWEWHPHEGVWMRTFGHLRDAFAVLDLSDIDVDYIAGESIHLGLWIRTQQKEYRKGRLSADRQKLLESLPKWQWLNREQPTRRWGNFLNRLKEYHRQNGTVSVPLIYKDSDGFPLGAMASQARSSYRKGTLKSFRIADLEAINEWSWDVQVPEHFVRVDGAWEHFFSLLQEYVKENGTAMAPTTYRTTNGERLGYWIGGQRKAHRNGELSVERVQRLEAQQGWAWAPRAFSWDDTYARLKQCLETMKIADIRQAHVCDDGLKIGRWINDQRSDYRRGELPAERINALEKLPGWVWDQIEAKWDAAFAHLEKYVRETGNIHAPMAYKVGGDGFYLGQWLRNQRKAYKNGKLSTRRIRLIEQLPEWQW